ncbi:TetR/AcrR family transcriptional regulator [Cohnella hashimotonis]|uniref:TetR/AcrR family transcriptional regulator n=1 Tax=Cohnella hashimotonis TaxID=2826895 RepID=A0ABT6TP63_9BACL|nr:TetR/AcrR family transcriptional regulator [Cohnella hashimotonis]MDI4648545.1 TetR/AcrR family transcriptional regulator [Cohnella hashimotonis]
MIKPRKRSDAAENCRLILQAAKKLFAEQGVQTVSMHQIAKTAGVGQGTLYRCYAHKGDLCAAIAEQVGMEKIKELETFLLTNKHLPAGERIGGVLHYIIQFIDEKFQLLLPIHTVHDCEDESAYFRSPMYRLVWDKLTGLYAELEPDYDGSGSAVQADHASGATAQTGDASAADAQVGRAGAAPMQDGQASATSAPASQETRAAAWERATAKAHILLSSLHPAGIIHMREGMGLTREQITRYYCELFAR